MSIAEFYGWTTTQQTGIRKIISECTSCGSEMNQQREAVMYECERCMNEQTE